MQKPHKSPPRGSATTDTKRPDFLVRQTLKNTGVQDTLQISDDTSGHVFCYRASTAPTSPLILCSPRMVDRISSAKVSLAGQNITLTQTNGSCRLIPDWSNMTNIKMNIRRSVLYQTILPSTQYLQEIMEKRIEDQDIVLTTGLTSTFYRIRDFYIHNEFVYLLIDHAQLNRGGWIYIYDKTTGIRQSTSTSLPTNFFTTSNGYL